MKAKTKLVIGISLLLVMIGTLMITNIGSAATFYMTVDEFDSDRVKTSERSVQLSGKIDGDSIMWDPENSLLTFDLRGEADPTKIVSIQYEGVKPDTLNDDWEAIVEGTLDSNGIFIATQLLVKCPSKYEALEENE